MDIGYGYEFKSPFNLTDFPSFLFPQRNLRTNYLPFPQTRNRRAGIDYQPPTTLRPTFAPFRPLRRTGPSDTSQFAHHKICLSEDQPVSSPPIGSPSLSLIGHVTMETPHNDIHPYFSSTFGSLEEKRNDRN